MKDGKLLRIYIAESTRINDKPALRYLPEFFLSKSLTGCTVYRGMGGFGHENRLRTVDVLNFSLDLPVIIDVIDTPEKIDAVLPEVEAMIDDGLVMVQDVRMSRKVPG